MKKLPLVLTLSLLLLASCGKGADTISYKLTIDSADAQRRTELISASARVIERRLLGMKQEVMPGDVSVSGETVTVKPKDTETAEALRAQLQGEFTMRVMREVDASIADLVHDTMGAWKETGITEKEFDWVLASSSDPRPKAKATLLFTDAGKRQLETVFKDNSGKALGVFLRGILMSKMMVNPGEARDSILVDGIPNLEIAQVFADDVNVGLHVKFEEVR